MKPELRHGNEVTGALSCRLSDQKRSAELVESALIVVARATGSEHTTVGIWLVWMRERRVMSWEWVNRLDVAVPACMPTGADQVVVIAVAPFRVAGAVIRRVDVICEQAEAAGLVADAVHVTALHAGALWTRLRTSGFGGIVPELTAADRTAARRRRFTRFIGIGAPWRIAILVMAPVVGVFCAMTGYADPGGQAGVIVAPGTGQAGVTTAPAAPVSSLNHEPGPAVVMGVPASPAPVPQPMTPRVWSGSDRYDEPGQYAADDVVDNTLHVGASTVARPEWFPPELVDPEQAWNGYLAHEITVGLDQAGALVRVGGDVLSDAGFGDLATVASEVASAAVTDGSAAVGSGDGEVRGPGIAELTEIAAATLPEWETPIPVSDGMFEVIAAGEPVLPRIQREIDGWLSQQPPILG
ncbi:hypothetical protein ACQPW1_39555 [Nocardia sp. CA-128927]|uniref:hypothetical protein n=1 Tax=Nocardia sp. CA-128927 TaxID=3239975 RepID=UPI003D9602F0